MTVTVGTTVVWANRTQEMVHLVSGEPHRIYLPLVLRNTSSARASAATPSALTVAGSQQVDWGNVDIAPGGSYTHTFTTAGDYPYFLSTGPSCTGLVTVEPESFDFALDVQPTAQSVAQGQGITYTVGVVGTMGDPRPVTLVVGGLPVGAV